MKKREKKQPAYKLRNEQRAFAQRWREITRIVSDYYVVQMYPLQPSIGETTQVSGH